MTHSVAGARRGDQDETARAESDAGRCGPAGTPGAAGALGGGQGMVIAVDGPAGSGKSSAARGAAEALGLRYLDTGAMYRAVTWWLLENDIDVADAGSVAGRVSGLAIDISTGTGNQAVRVDGIDVSAGIRSRRVSNAVSSVASIPEVRSHLIALQREIIREAVTSSGGIVAEGRDIGTVVAPDAAVKVFLTASEHVRAERRATELARLAAGGSAAAGRPAADVTAAAGTGMASAGSRQAAGLGAVPDQAPTTDLTRLEQARRDRRDAPQSRPAADAIQIDATDLGLDEVIGRIVSLAARRAGAAWTS